MFVTKIQMHFGGNRCMGFQDNSYLDWILLFNYLLSSLSNFTLHLLPLHVGNKGNKAFKILSRLFHGSVCWCTAVSHTTYIKNLYSNLTNNATIRILSLRSCVAVQYLDQVSFVIFLLALFSDGISCVCNVVGYVLLLCVPSPFVLLQYLLQNCVLLLCCFLPCVQSCYVLLCFNLPWFILSRCDWVHTVGNYVYQTAWVSCTFSRFSASPDVSWNTCCPEFVSYIRFIPTYQS